MAEHPEDKPKIIIDEDWKSKVQAEKEQAERQRSQTPAADTSPETSAEPTADESQQPLKLPPASFAVLVQSLATQALASLGQLPGPDGKPFTPEPELARHYIDTLGVLEEKTRGNLTPEEEQLLSGALHDLRMLFISLGSGAARGPEDKAR